MKTYIRAWTAFLLILSSFTMLSTQADGAALDVNVPHEVMMRKNTLPRVTKQQIFPSCCGAVDVTLADCISRAVEGNCKKGDRKPIFDALNQLADLLSE